MKRIHPIFLFLLGGFLFLFDRILKYTVFRHPENHFYIWKPWLGWEYFANTGVAFSLPIPWYSAFVYTPILLGFIFWHYRKKQHLDTFEYLGISLIFFGALSNLIDRMIYHITVDYFRIFTSIINLADVSIVLGVIFLFLQERKQK